MTITAPERAPEALSSLARRVALIGEVGADEVVVIRFDRALASREADDFAEHVLVDALGARAVVAGADFRFGHDRRGDARAAGGLRRAARLHGDLGAAARDRRRARELDAHPRAHSRRRRGGRGDAARAAARGGGRRHPRRRPGPRARRADGEPGRAAGYALPAEGVYSGVAVLPRGLGARRAAISIGHQPDLRRLPRPADRGPPARLRRRPLRQPAAAGGPPLPARQQAFATSTSLVRQMDDDIAQARAEPLPDSRRIGSRRRLKLPMPGLMLVRWAIRGRWAPPWS